MIIQWLLEAFYNIIDLLLGWMYIDSIPDQQINSLNSVINTITTNGMSIYKFFLPPIVRNVFIPIILTFIGFEWMYYLVMWILKKIPFAGIK